MSSIVTPEGQVTIPKPFLEKLGLAPGDDVAFELRPDQKIVLTKVSRKLGADPDSYRSRLESVRGSAGPGMSTDEIMALTRGDD